MAEAINGGLHQRLAMGRVGDVPGSFLKLVATCTDDPAGLRDRALLLMAFAGALRRVELCAIEIEHITSKPRSLELLIPRSKSDAEAEGARIGIPRGRVEATCPLRALQIWLVAAAIDRGPVFRAVTRHGTPRAAALSGEAVRPILLKRARLAGAKGTRLEPISVRRQGKPIRRRHQEPSHPA